MWKSETLLLTHIGSIRLICVLGRGNPLTTQVSYQALPFNIRMQKLQLLRDLTSVMNINVHKFGCFMNHRLNFVTSNCKTNDISYS